MQKITNSTFIKIIILSTLLTTSLFANILTHYRENGIENVEKQMDSDLIKKDYWDEYLKKFDTSFGYIESYTNILYCNKSKKTLTLYVKDVNDSYKLQNEYGAYTGKIQGDKRKEGDLKTPVGIYDIIKKISKVDSFYGPMAFVISYPNAYDKYRGKNGSGIWIHGLPTKKQRSQYTKGCIAIDNKSIECLDRHIDISQTLLIINENATAKSESKEVLSTILSQIYEWRYAWLYNNIDSYLSFYSENFVRFDGMKMDKFISYKKRIFEKMENKTIIFNKINIIPYPNSKNMYKITFVEKYKSDSFSFTGNKVLIIKLEDKNMKIITEK